MFVTQENLTFLAQHCLPEETTDDEEAAMPDGAKIPLVQAFHNNLTDLGMNAAQRIHKRILASCSDVENILLVHCQWHEALNSSVIVVMLCAHVFPWEILELQPKICLRVRGRIKIIWTKLCRDPKEENPSQFATKVCLLFVFFS